LLDSLLQETAGWSRIGTLTLRDMADMRTDPTTTPSRTASTAFLPREAVVLELPGVDSDNEEALSALHAVRLDLPVVFSDLRVVPLELLSARLGLLGVVLLDPRGALSDRLGS